MTYFYLALLLTLTNGETYSAGHKDILYTEAECATVAESHIDGMNHYYGFLFQQYRLQLLITCEPIGVSA